MVAPCQLPHSPVLCVTSAWRDSWSSPNSFSASSSSSSSSCPHSGDSLPSISSSSATNLENFSLKEGFAVYGRRHCRNWKSAKTGPSMSFTSGERFRVLGSRRSVPGRRQQHSFLCRCAASDDETAAREQDAESSLELPLFPLPLVLFPGAILPLQIFEFRYRIMMHTLLQTDLRFGVVYTDKTSGVAGVGCVGEVIKHERLVDDRFFMICKGQERFRVTGIVRTKPYLVARVEWLEDRPSASGDGDQEDVETLATEVEAYMKDVIRLSNRVNGKPEKATPDDLRKNLFPTPFSFWVGSTFEGAPVEQQALLELEDTAQRLKREKETLRNTLNYLSAASAVKDAFPSSE